MTPLPNSQSLRIGVILAGGQSRRMGQDKALLTHNGTSLLEHTTKLLQDTDCQLVILSGYPRVGFVGKVIPDDVFEAGPVSGIMSTFRYLMNNYPLGVQCLVVPVDMPKLTSKLLRFLLENAKDSDGALFHKHPLPFCLNLSKALQNLVQNTEAFSLTNQRSPSIRGFLSPLKMSILEPSLEELNELVNVNTPEEWEGLGWSP